MSKEKTSLALSPLALPKPVLFFAISVVLMAIVLIGPLSISWSNRQDYSFGYLMPIFSLYVIYDRWDQIKKYFLSTSANASQYTFWGNFWRIFFAAMFACGGLVFLMGVFFYALTKNHGAPAFIMTFGFCFFFFAQAFFAGAKDLQGNLKPIKERLAFTCLFLFPAFAWLIAVPIFEVVENRISLFLLGKVAMVVFSLMDFLGYTIELKKNVIEFPNGSVGVADACSGIRSLMACLFAGSFLSAVFLDKFWKKILLVGLSMCFAFLNNLIRALFLSFWAYYNGPESISGTVHDLAGYFVMGMTVLELLALLPLFQLSAIPKEFRDQEGHFE